MKLTIDNVRAAMEAATTRGEIADAHVGVLEALCDEWIARHTVRWEYDADGCTLVTGDGRRMWRAETVCHVTLEARARRAYHDWVQFSTRRPAEAWCEEQARFSGFEVTT